ncbi:MAG: septum site-determining protein MinC [Chloroflexota bacterium]|nr:MAG: septum site-determining protein MinC [Chloroflexota bacterium]
MSNLIVIKGSRDGLRLQLDEEAAWPDLIEALREQLGQGAQFYNGAKVTVDVGERALAPDQLAAMLELMRQHHLEPEALASNSRDSRNAARAAGVTARALNRSVSAADERGDATLVQRTIRSGQVVRHHGHVTVLGDVNAGAEIIAGGSVIVWGRLRGTVHAGALGDATAVICALELAPTQLRIADLIARAPDGGVARVPEIARIVDGQISVEPWSAHRR